MHACMYTCLSHLLKRAFSWRSAIEQLGAEVALPSRACSYSTACHTQAVSATEQL